MGAADNRPVTLNQAS
ncbi:hypothetical protein FQN60_002828, partial [Etheostoma spectabile]